MAIGKSSSNSLKKNKTIKMEFINIDAITKDIPLLWPKLKENKQK